jgi:hypothetical protein|tara:strand:- start:1840 stop:2325 length:486 start_codon:yes stop_codon:yes gene_type:complete
MQKNIQQASVFTGQIPASSNLAINAVKRLEASMREELDTVDISTHHTLHDGVYSRTIMIPAGHLVVGAKVNVSSTIIISGDITLYVDGDPVRLIGYHVIPADAGRKQAAYAHLDTHVTMFCQTEAETIEEVEAECTDECEKLISRTDSDNNIFQVTRESKQ